MSIEIDFSQSIIEEVSFGGHQFYVKRDDLIHQDFSGNKARKLHFFLQTHFPHITTLISYGSNQSNAMYSLSVLARLKNWKFIYFCDHIPDLLRSNPSGNYQKAIENGMQIFAGDIDCTIINEQTLFIKEGGAQPQAEFGIKLLAEEIKAWIQTYSLQNVKLFLPSGTGTTALYLQKNLDLEVLTCPCVGDVAYLKKQFFDLSKNQNIHPAILNPPKKFHFGKLYPENFQIWQQLLNQTNIEFDLLYDPIGWQTINIYKQHHPATKILYIHQGGLIGNHTMLQRYKRKLTKQEF